MGFGEEDTNIQSIVGDIGGVKAGVQGKQKGEPQHPQGAVTCLGKR